MKTLLKKLAVLFTVTTLGCAISMPAFSFNDEHLTAEDLAKIAKFKANVAREKTESPNSEDGSEDDYSGIDDGCGNVNLGNIVLQDDGSLYDVDNDTIILGDIYNLAECH